MKELADKPGHLIRRAHQISTAIFAEECAAFDLTSVQYAALVAIRANAGVDATRLSALISFDRSTIGDVIERLETKGLVLRKPAPDDRRVKLLYLTPPGATLLRSVTPAVETVQQRLLAPLAPHDQATLMRLLAELVDQHSETLQPPLRLAAGR